MKRRSIRSHLLERSRERRKLSDEDVVEIRKRAALGALNKDLAERFGVNESTIRGYLWGKAAGYSRGFTR